MANYKNKLTPYIFLLPSVLIIAVFALIPLAHALIISFQKDILIDQSFCGFKHYLSLMDDTEFWAAMRNTFYYSFITVPVGLVLALGTALLLNQKLAGRAVFRTVFFLPVIISMVVIAMIWRWMFSENFGIFNQLLALFGFNPVNWLTNAKTALPSIMVMSIWKGYGYGMVIYLAGLQGIPGSYYEAARIDGADRSQQFWFITLPLLAPTTLFVLVVAFIGSFQVFEQVYVMMGGAPNLNTTVLVYYIYHQFGKGDLGLACAAAFILFAIILVLTLIQFWMFSEKKPRAGRA
jgi:multiple sugar transport system permease protein